jgi:NADPH-dependent 2,4-dienoyl-CoA reductase/sulfur reductase-like enzyme
MKRVIVLWVTVSVLCGCKDIGFGSNEISCDIVIYGSSPAAIAAAVQAKRMRKSAVVVTPDIRIAGLTTSISRNFGSRRCLGSERDL